MGHEMTSRSKGATPPRLAQSGASPKSRAEHMARRAQQTGQRAAGKEFRVSQSTISRRMLRDGYSRA